MEKAEGAQRNPGGHGADTVRHRAAQAKTLAGLGLSEGQSHRREKLADVSEDQVGLDKPATSGIIETTETLTRQLKRYDRALQRAVKERLEELDRNPFEAARVGGLERSFVNDILIGRKRTVRAENLERLARALDWDTRLLTDAVRSPLPKGLNLGSPSPPNGASLNLFDVNVLRIGFSAILLATGVSPETARQLIEGWLEFARRHPGPADSPPSLNRTPMPDSDAKPYGQ